MKTRRNFARSRIRNQLINIAGRITRTAHRTNLTNTLAPCRARGTDGQTVDQPAVKHAHHQESQSQDQLLGSAVHPG